MFVPETPVGWRAHPQDLLQHDWLGTKSTSAGADFVELHDTNGERQTLRLEGRVQASQITVIHALCLAGWGISQGVSEDDRKALADGRLLPVLPGWHLADVPVYAVTLRRGEQPAKVRHALDMLAGWFGAGAVDVGAANETDGVDDPRRVSPWMWCRARAMVKTPAAVGAQGRLPDCRIAGNRRQRGLAGNC